MHARVPAAVAVALVLLAACSSDSGSGDPCSKLDLSSIGQATVKAYAEAAEALRSRFDGIEGRVFHACDAMNATLALERPRNTYDAWGMFRKRYLKELGRPEAAAQLQELYRLAHGRKRLTLLYAFSDEEHNNAVVLKDLLDGMKKPPTGTGPAAAGATRLRKAARRPA